MNDILARLDAQFVRQIDSEISRCSITVSKKQSHGA